MTEQILQTNTSQLKQFKLRYILLFLTFGIIATAIIFREELKRLILSSPQLGNWAYALDTALENGDTDAFFKILLEGNAPISTDQTSFDQNLGVEKELHYVANSIVEIYRTKSDAAKIAMNKYGVTDDGIIYTIEKPISPLKWRMVTSQDLAIEIKNGAIPQVIFRVEEGQYLPYVQMIGVKQNAARMQKEFEQAAHLSWLEITSTGELQIYPTYTNVDTIPDFSNSNFVPLYWELDMDMPELNVEALPDHFKQLIQSWKSNLSYTSLGGEFSQRSRMSFALARHQDGSVSVIQFSPHVLLIPEIWEAFRQDMKSRGIDKIAIGDTDVSNLNLASASTQIDGQDRVSSLFTDNPENNVAQNVIDSWINAERLLNTGGLYIIAESEYPMDITTTVNTVPEEENGIALTDTLGSLTTPEFRDRVRDAVSTNDYSGLEGQEVEVVIAVLEETMPRLFGEGAIEEYTVENIYQMLETKIFQTRNDEDYSGARWLESVVKVDSPNWLRDIIATVIFQHRESKFPDVATLPRVEFETFSKDKERFNAYVELLKVNQENKVISLVLRKNPVRSTILTIYIDEDGEMTTHELSINGLQHMSSELLADALLLDYLGLQPEEMTWKSFYEETPKSIDARQNLLEILTSDYNNTKELYNTERYGDLINCLEKLTNQNIEEIYKSVFRKPAYLLNVDENGFLKEDVGQTYTLGETILGFGMDKNSRPLKFNQLMQLVLQPEFTRSSEDINEFFQGILVSEGQG